MPRCRLSTVYLCWAAHWRAWWIQSDKPQGAPSLCREWAAESVASDPTFFSKWASTQAPEYLFIGCADSRVPVRGRSVPRTCVQPAFRSMPHA